MIFYCCASLPTNTNNIDVCAVVVCDLNDTLLLFHTPRYFARFVP